MECKRNIHRAELGNKKCSAIDGITFSIHICIYMKGLTAAFRDYFWFRPLYILYLLCLAHVRTEVARTQA